MPMNMNTAKMASIMWYLPSTESDALLFPRTAECFAYSVRGHAEFFRDLHDQHPFRVHHPDFCFSWGKFVIALRGAG
jgi:hypothetical protein